jgi:hypothetical protein
MMNWKVCRRKRSLPNVSYCTDVCLNVLKNITKNLSQDSWSLGRDLNPIPLKYGAGVLTIFGHIFTLNQCRGRLKIW